MYQIGISVCFGSVVFLGDKHSYSFMFHNLLGQSSVLVLGPHNLQINYCLQVTFISGHALKRCVPVCVPATTVFPP